MKLTPLDIRKQTFRHKAMRGFDPEEVRIFLDMVADEYEKLLQEHGMLSEKVRYLNERLEEYHNLEKTLQSSILTAERAAADSRERSRVEAQTIINDAHVRAERILEDARSRLRQLGEHIQQLASEKDLFVQRFQALLDAHAKFLASQQGDLDAIDTIDARARTMISETAMHPLGARAEHREPPDDGDDYPARDPYDRDAERDVVAGEQEHFEEPADSSAMAQEDLLPSADEFDDERESPADPPHRRFREPATEAESDGELDAPPDPRQVHDRRRSLESEARRREEEEDGFFAPIERREGFFEVNARTHPEGGSQQ